MLRYAHIYDHVTAYYTSGLHRTPHWLLHLISGAEGDCAGVWTAAVPIGREDLAQECACAQGMGILGLEFPARV